MGHLSADVPRRAIDIFGEPMIDLRSDTRDRAVGRRQPFEMEPTFVSRLNLGQPNSSSNLGRDCKTTSRRYITRSRALTEWAESTAREKTGQKREKKQAERSYGGQQLALKTLWFQGTSTERPLPERQLLPATVRGERDSKHRYPLFHARVTVGLVICCRCRPPLLSLPCSTAISALMRSACQHLRQQSPPGRQPGTSKMLELSNQAGA